MEDEVELDPSGVVVVELHLAANVSVCTRSSRHGNDAVGCAEYRYSVAVVDRAGNKAAHAIDAVAAAPVRRKRPGNAA
jgi:hypothetical protein